MITSHDSLVALVEYGATARGDADSHSDRDICAIIDDVDEYEMETIRTGVAEEYATEERSVSCYRLSTLDKMVQSGSLFLWHLRLEGRTFHDPDGIMGAALHALVPYAHFKRDLKRFSDVFDDVVTEYSYTNHLNAFEFHVLSVVARNLCMLLTVRAGDPVFGRATVFRAARNAYPELPLSDAVWNRLMGGHLEFMRNIPYAAATPTPEPPTIVREVRDLLEFAHAVFN